MTSSPMLNDTVPHFSIDGVLERMMSMSITQAELEFC